MGDTIDFPTDEQERPTRPPLPPRPRVARLFMAIPILFGTFLLLAGFGVFFLGMMGGEATGDRVQMRLEGNCAAEAAPLVTTRAQAIGLGDPEVTVQPGGLSITATLPGLPDDHVAIPALLVRPGTLEIRHGDTVLANSADLNTVMLRLDEEGQPYTWLEFTPDVATHIQSTMTTDPEGTLALVVDGTVAAERPNSIRLQDNALRLISGTGDGATRMRRATDRAIVLTQGPLPCALSIASVDPVPGGQ